MSTEFGDLNIPFRHVRYSTYVKLADKLDTESSVSGNNWRMLADRLGYTTEQICVFEVQQASHGRNTIKVLQDYSGNRADATIGAVYRALQEIDRPDALGELKAAIPDIKKTYEESQSGLHKKHRTHDVIENEYICKSCEGNPYNGNSVPSYHHPHHPHLPHLTGHDKYMFPSNHHVPHSHHNNMAKNYQRHKSVESTCMNVRLPDYEQNSPEFKRQRSMPLSDSMLVRGHDSNSQYYHNLEPMDHSPSIRENGVPIALAMLRGMARFNDIGVNPVKSSIHGVNNDSVFRQPFAQNHNHSSNQNRQNPPERPQLKLDMPNIADMYNHHQNDFISPSPSTPSTPLDYLKHIAHERQIQPTEDFKQLMKMKHDEELLQGKAGLPLEPFSSPVQGGCREQMFTEGQGYSKQRSPNGPPKTFPLRLKSNSQVLTKSVSVPENIKPVEFGRKAFRHIKVFVTYSADDNAHTKHVLKLCECLEKNGFRCCVDIFQRKLPDNKKHDWHREKFEEADFILVVMSPKYRHETDSCNVENDADDSLDSDADERPEISHKLHTKDIYRLMYREYVQNNHRPQRFVPLVFPGMTQDIIPSWLIDSNNKPFYFWPDQYKDLLWMLTKPENRVPDRSMKADSEESSNQECDADVDEEEPE